MIVGASHQRDMDIVAVPLDGGPTITLATVHDLGAGVPAGAPVSARSDGSAFAISLATAATTRRIALLDLTNGVERWLSAPGSMETDYGAVWASDGGSVYFGRSGPDGDRGVLHVALDGTPLTPIPPTSTFASGSTVSRLTPEGVLIGADEFNGPTVWALDLATGKKLSFGVHNSNLWAWRATRPRALVGVFTRPAAPGEGYLALWDDITDSKTTILAAPVGGADFDPSGTRVVASTLDPSDQQVRLLVLNADGTDARFLAGTEFASWPIWTTEGIVYGTYPPSGDSEVRVVSPSGGASRKLFTTSALQRIQVVTPAAVSAAPVGFALPAGCAVVGPGTSVGGVSTWNIDCGAQRNGNARATLEPALREAGWQLCGSGLASASWRKDALVTVISEPADVNASFKLSQRSGISCP